MLSANISEHQRYQRSMLKILLGLLLSAIVFFVYLNPALAIGPGTGGSKIRVDSEQIGPYTLLVATSPLPVTLDQQMSVWVRVADTQADELRRKATVMVTATHRDTGQTLTGQATHQNAGNDYDYVVHFDVENAGQWDITVTVEDELGQAEVAFVESVSQGLSVKILVGIGLPFLTLAIAIGIYLWRRSGAKA